MNVHAQAIGRVSSDTTRNEVRNGGINRKVIKDTLLVKADTGLIKLDSNVVVKDSFLVPYANSEISDEVKYIAEDSIVYDVASRKLFLYKNSKITYTDMNVEAELINFDWHSMNLTANGGVDSLGKAYGNPIYTQGDREYVTNKMVYNFKSKRGKVYDVITKEGEGFLHGEEVKKDPQQNWYIKNAKYTTCDHEHPHFYIAANRLKLIPNKMIITGPANLVFSDVPTPIYLPFGLFPVKTGQRSGLILPQNYGFQPVFNIRGIGYYWAVNDHLGISFTGDIFFNGGVGFQTYAQYARNYKYTGNIRLGISRTYTSAVVNPLEDKPSTEFNIEWSHTQSVKAHPTFTFSSNVNFRTGNYYRNNLETGRQITNAIATSNISLSKKFRNKQYYFNFGASSRQDLSTKEIAVDLPNFFFYTPFSPFKSKIETGEKKWFEKFNISYTAEAKANVQTYDTIIFTKYTLDRIQKAIKNTATIQWNSKIFKFFNINFNANAADRLYFERSYRGIDPNIPDTVYTPEKKIDTILMGKFVTNRMKDVNNVFDYSVGTAFNTTIYGMYNFKSKRLKAIRHQLTPSFSYSYSPDFSSQKFGYYYWAAQTRGGAYERISYYESNIFGSPGIGTQSILSFSLNNNITAKIFNPKDTANPTKKISILDQLSIGASYNFAADSIRLSNIGITARTNLGTNFSSDISLNFDPYAPDSNGRKTKYFAIEKQFGLVRFVNFGWRFNYSLSSSQVNKRINASEKGTEAERRDLLNQYYLYYDFNSPWNLATNFDFGATQLRALGRDTVVFNATINLMNFDVNITPKWKFAMSSGFDFISKKITMTNLKIIRDLHCWEIVFNYSPISTLGPTYSMEIHPKSSLLQDLKITRTKTVYDSYFK